MEDIKLWELDGTQATPLGSNNQLESEQGLEDTLVKNSNLLMEGLTLVGRQTHTVGGPLDLLGVDQDGRLVVFELKRGTLSRDAVAQIIDYASDLDRMALAELAEHISENSGVGGIDEIENFQEWYSNRGFDDLGSLKPLRMFLVGLGADDTTERMVKFLAQNSGMDISLLTFHAFDFGGTTILAKQVEVEAPAELGSRSTGRTVSVAEKRERLGRLIEESGVSEQFAAVRNIFREHWPESSTSPQTYGLSIQLRQQAGLGRRASYAYIQVGKGSLSIVFHPKAKSLCLDEFRKRVCVQEIRYDTWPQNRDPLEDSYASIEFKLTTEEWETHKESLTALVQSVYAAWKNNKGQDDGTDSA